MKAEDLYKHHDVSDLRELANYLGFPKEKIPYNPTRQAFALDLVDWVDSQNLEIGKAVIRWLESRHRSPGDLRAEQLPSSQIFLSGTSDLDRYKRKALVAAGYCGVSAWLAEDYRGRPGSPREICLEQVRRCEKFFLFLGARYGEIVEGIDISPTEDEYEQATAAGKPIYVFVERVSYREERQIEFIERVRSYTIGCWRHSFKTDTDIGKLVREILEEDRKASGCGI